MKYTVVTVLGFFARRGGRCGAALYYNPLTETAGPEPDSADRALHYALPAQIFGLSLGAHAAVPTGTADDTVLWEDTVDRTALLGLVLEETARSAGRRREPAAGRVRRHGSIARGVLLSDHWLLTFPDEGTLFVRVDTNLWPF